VMFFIFFKAVLPHFELKSDSLHAISLFECHFGSQLLIAEVTS